MPPLSSDPLLQHYCDQLGGQLSRAENLVENTVSAKESEIPAIRKSLEEAIIRVCRLSREVRFRIAEVGSESFDEVDSDYILSQLNRAVALGASFSNDEHGYWSIGNIKKRRDWLANYLRCRARSHAADASAHGAAG
jgi:hypothetical protein